MKFTLNLKQIFPFAQNPVSCELEGDKILCNNVCLPKEIDPDASYNPHNVRAFVIGHEFGAICMVWADSEQEALDNAVDLNQLDMLMSEEQNHEDESLTALGNASELFELSYVWLAEVVFDPARDIQLIVKLVRASEAGLDNVDAWR